MKISTFNIKNNYDDYDKTKSKKIYEYLKNKDIDILGLQEVFYKCDSDLKKFFNNDYRMIGKYRFFLKFLFIKSNEKTPIITNYKILEKRTYHLPHFPSRLKRVMTHIVIDYFGKEISIYNTHLEARILKVKKKQLQKVYDIIKNDNRPIILMGDFNLTTNNKDFNIFIKKLELIGMNRIRLHEKTLKPSKNNLEIDHIFISKNFSLKSKEVIKDLEISDHYPVIAEISL